MERTNFLHQHCNSKDCNSEDCNSEDCNSEDCNSNSNRTNTPLNVKMRGILFNVFSSKPGKLSKLIKVSRASVMAAVALRR